MKIKFNIYLLLGFVLLVKLSKAQTVFQKTFGDSLSEYCFALKQTNDKGFILAGYTNSYGAGRNDIYIIKTDSLSNIVWSKVYGGPNDDEAYAVQQTTDGGYIVGGYTRSFGIQYYDAFLLKTDANGDTLWTKTYGGLGSDFGNTIAQTNDGGYIMAGYTTKSTIAGDTASIYLVKTDAQGNLLWQKLLGAGNQVTDAYSIKQTADKGFVITGYTNGFGEINGDAFLIKTDSLANPIFTKTYGYKGADWGNSIWLTTDGGYVIGGSYSTDSTSTDIDAYIIKTDINGDTLWTKTFGGAGSDYGQYIKQTTDGGYVLGGYTNSFGNGNYDTFVLKIDANGDTLFMKTFGGTGDDEANCLVQTNDGAYALAGQSSSFGKGAYDFYFFKTDKAGNNTCNQTNVHAAKRKPRTIVATVSMLQNLPNASQLSASPKMNAGATPTDACNPLDISEFNISKALLKVFPNPTNGLFTISLTNMDEEKAKLSVQNILGKTVYTTNTITNREINLQHLVNGTYFLQVQMGGENYTQKIIIVK
jgi:arginine repressor